MKTQTWFALVCLLAVTCAADDFYLKDSAGLETGPFKTRRGARVHASDREFVVSRVEKVNETISETMERIVIPEIEFRNTGITNAIDFLVKAGRENDPGKKGVNIQLWPPATVPSFKDPAQGISNVTLRAKQITLASAVKTVAKIVGLECRIDAAGVRLVSPDEPEGDILHRVFRIEPAFCDYLRERPTNGSSDEAHNASVDIKTFSAKMGVRWPRGASVVFDPGLSALLVANTEENLDRLARLLRELNVIPKQVEIDMLFVQFDTTNLVHLAPGDVNAKSLMRAYTNGCGRLLAAPRVITRSGTEASIRGVNEVIYPTSYVTPDGFWTCVTNSLPPGASGVVVPSDFATREAGAILTVLPEVSPEGDRINLTLTPQYVEAPTWRDYGYDLPEGADKSRHVPNEQPIFYVYGVITQITVTDGATVLVGGGVPTRDGKGMIFSFLTARLVGMDGEPLWMHAESPDSSAH